MPFAAVSRATAILLVGALATPVLGLAVLLAAPAADPHWDHQPSHFWIVLGAAAIAAGLGWSVGTSARRRADGRLFLVSMSFVAAAAFLGLHALATPGVLLAGRNTGFVVAVPVGLLLAACFAVWSAIPLDGSRARWVVAHSNRMRIALFVLVAAWGAGSIAEVPALEDPSPPESGSAFLLAVTLPACAGFAFAAGRYVALIRHRRAALLVAITAAWVLLGEAALAVGVTESWRVSWWIWHALLVVAFAIIAGAAFRQPDNERFSDLYLDEVAGGTREVSVLFADLEGFTAFSEEHPPDVVQRMLNAYYEGVLPAVRRAGGRVDRFMGDAVMVTFNVAADQPDHARAASVAALALRDAAADVAARHPDWPRFRVGVNTGTAVVGVIGDGAHRDYTVLGDTVNVASRIEALAPVGAVAISDATRTAVPDARTTHLGTVSVKGRTEPVEIWRLDAIAAEHAGDRGATP